MSVFKLDRKELASKTDIGELKAELKRDLAVLKGMIGLVLAGLIVVIAKIFSLG